MWTEKAGERADSKGKSEGDIIGARISRRLAQKPWLRKLMLIPWTQRQKRENTKYGL